VALLKAVSENPKVKFESLAIVTDDDKITVPCALCLQVLAEFCTDDLAIFLGDLEGVQKEMKLKDLLPYPFRSFKKRARK
jgi:cytidine deaminase